MGILFEVLIYLLHHKISSNSVCAYAISYNIVQPNIYIYSNSSTKHGIDCDFEGNQFLIGLENLHRFGTIFTSTLESD